MPEEQQVLLHQQQQQQSLEVLLDDEVHLTSLYTELMDRLTCIKQRYADLEAGGTENKENGRRSEEYYVIAVRSLTRDMENLYNDWCVWINAWQLWKDRWHIWADTWQQQRGEVSYYENGYYPPQIARRQALDHNVWLACKKTQVFFRLIFPKK